MHASWYLFCIFMFVCWCWCVNVFPCMHVGLCSSLCVGALTLIIMRMLEHKFYSCVIVCVSMFLHACYGMHVIACML